MPAFSGGPKFRCSRVSLASEKAKPESLNAKSIERVFTCHNRIKILRLLIGFPNVSGGLVVSNIEQRTDWSYDYNVRLAAGCGKNGFDYALTQIRFTAGYNAETNMSRSVLVTVS